MCRFPTLSYFRIAFFTTNSLDVWVSSMEIFLRTSSVKKSLSLKKKGEGYTKEIFDILFFFKIAESFSNA